MSNKLLFVICVLKLVSEPHVKGLANNIIERTFSPFSDFYYRNKTTRTPNIFSDHFGKSIKVRSSELNSAAEKPGYNITNPLPQFMRFKPIEADNYIKVDPFILKQFGKNFNLQLNEFNPSSEPDTSVSSTEIPYTWTETSATSRKSTYRSSDHGPKSTARIWEPDEPVFVVREEGAINKQTSPDELSLSSTVTHKPSHVRKFTPSDTFYKQWSQGRSRKGRNNKCKKFIASKVPFDYTQMENIWQTMYYRIPEKIKCFQILIKNIPQQQRDIYQRNYGNFSGVVDWQNIRLEISATTNIGRKHFLQGSNEEMGILANIVISRDIDTGELVIHEETPDQWLVVGHLLLMRDCDSGGIVVFSKVPYVPLRPEIENALSKFNEYYSTGKLTCDEDDVINKAIEAEEDVQSFWNN